MGRERDVRHDVLVAIDSSKPLPPRCGELGPHLGLILWSPGVINPNKMSIRSAVFTNLARVIETNAGIIKRNSMHRGPKMYWL